MKDKFLIWPYEKYKSAIKDITTAIAAYMPDVINHLRVNMISCKYDEFKEDGIFKDKREQSLDYVLKNWPKGKMKRVAIQAGGCLGFWPKMLSYYFDTVYTFEAQPAAFYILSLNCPEENIIKMQMALGEHSGCFVDIPMTNKPGAGKIQKDGVVPMIKLDDLNLSVCDALLLDVEGYEPQILKGAKNLIRKCQPIILCEDNWNSEKIENILYFHFYRLVTKVNKDKIFVHKSVKDWDA